MEAQKKFWRGRMFYLKKLIIVLIIIAHIKDMITENHCKCIYIRTVDTDIVVLLLAFMADLVVYENDLQIWIGFWYRRILAIHQYQSLFQ